MRGRKRLPLLGTLLTIVVVAICVWWAYLRPAVLWRRVGLAGWTPGAGRRCVRAQEGPLLTCARRVVDAATGLTDEESISLNPLTRHVAAISHVWDAPDSATWFRQQDSVRRALALRGGRPIWCPPPHPTRYSPMLVLQAWRFQRQEVRLASYRFTNPRTGAAQWEIDIRGFPVGVSGCGKKLTP